MCQLLAVLSWVLSPVFSKSSGAIDTTNLIKKVSYSLIKFQLSLPELWLEEGTLGDYHVICIYVWSSILRRPKFSGILEDAPSNHINHTLDTSYSNCSTAHQLPGHGIDNCQGLPRWIQWPIVHWNSLRSQSWRWWNCNQLVVSKSNGVTSKHLDERSPRQRNQVQSHNQLLQQLHLWWWSWVQSLWQQQ